MSTQFREPRWSLSLLVCYAITALTAAEVSRRQGQQWTAGLCLIVFVSALVLLLVRALVMVAREIRRRPRDTRFISQILFTTLAAWLVLATYTAYLGAVETHAGWDSSIAGAVVARSFAIATGGIDASDFNGDGLSEEAAAAVFRLVGMIAITSMSSLFIARFVGADAHAGHEQPVERRARETNTKSSHERRALRRPAQGGLLGHSSRRLLAHARLKPPNPEGAVLAAVSASE